MVVFRALLCIRKERWYIRTINTREDILDMVQRSPRLSTRRMASRVGLSRMNVWRMLHEENLYPYHDKRVQNLEAGDHAQRMDLCQWIKAHPELLNVILFTDEASFTGTAQIIYKMFIRGPMVIHMRHV